MPLKHLKGASPVEEKLVSRKLANYRKLYPKGTEPFFRTRQVILSRKPSEIPIESPLQKHITTQIEQLIDGPGILFFACPKGKHDVTGEDNRRVG